MKPTIVKMNALEPLLAIGTLQNKTPCNNPPEDSAIVEMFFVHYVANEFLKVKCSIRHVFSYYLSMKVNEDLSLATHHQILKLQGVKFIAICTSM